jgi:hypothetical protein
MELSGMSVIYERYGVRVIEQETQLYFEEKTKWGTTNLVINKADIPLTESDAVGFLHGHMNWTGFLVCLQREGDIPIDVLIALDIVKHLFTAGKQGGTDSH